MCYLTLDFHAAAAEADLDASVSLKVSTAKTNGQIILGADIAPTTSVVRL